MHSKVYQTRCTLFLSDKLTWVIKPRDVWLQKLPATCIYVVLSDKGIQHNGKMMGFFGKHGRHFFQKVIIIRLLERCHPLGCCVLKWQLQTSIAFKGTLSSYPYRKEKTFEIQDGSVLLAAEHSATSYKTYVYEGSCIQWWNVWTPCSIVYLFIQTNGQNSMGGGSLGPVHPTAKPGLIIDVNYHQVGRTNQTMVRPLNQ